MRVRYMRIVLFVAAVAEFLLSRRKRGKTEMKSRSCVTILNLSLLVGTILSITGGAAMVKAQVNNVSKAMEGSLVAAYKTDSPAILPIDAAAPSNFQTASFGLG